MIQIKIKYKRCGKDVVTKCGTQKYCLQCRKAVDIELRKEYCKKKVDKK